MRNIINMIIKYVYEKGQTTLMQNCRHVLSAIIGTLIYSAYIHTTKCIYTNTYSDTSKR